MKRSDISWDLVRENVTNDRSEIIFKVEIASFVINVVAAPGLASLDVSVNADTAMFGC